MDDSYYPGKYLSQLVSRCRSISASEMLRNVEQVRRQNRMGFGHYLFDGRHAPSEWSVPGALEFEVERDEGGLEVTFSTGPFSKDELEVHVEEGSLEVSAVHDEEDPESHQRRHVHVAKRVPIPMEFELEDVRARFEKGQLTVRIPKYTSPRRKVDID